MPKWDFLKAEAFSWINQKDVKLPEVEITTELLNNKMGQSTNNISYWLIQRRKENSIYVANYGLGERNYQVQWEVCHTI
jgi:hypothetical protein